MATATASSSKPNSGAGGRSNTGTPTPRVVSNLGLPGMDPPASRPSSSSGPQQAQQQGANTAEATGSKTPLLATDPTLPQTQNQTENQTQTDEAQLLIQQAKEKEKEKEKDRERRRLLERQKEKSEHKPKLVISSDELNVLIYSYLCESSFPHTAYTFRSESKLDRSPLFTSFNPDHPGRFPMGGAASGSGDGAVAGAGTEGGPSGNANANASAPTSTGTTGGGKGKGKAKEDPVDEADKMEVDGAEEADPPAEGGKKKPALKRKGSDKTPMTAASTPGPTTNTASAPGVPTGLGAGMRSREDRFRAVPRGELIRHLYKGLMWDEVEKHAQWGWAEPPPCVTPFTLLTRHECTLAAPRNGQGPIIPPNLIDHKTGRPVFSAILSQEEKAQLRQHDIFPPAAGGSRAEQLERMLGQRESAAAQELRLRAEEHQRAREERKRNKERRKEKLERREKAAAKARRETEDDEREEDGMDVDMEDVQEVPERAKVREGKRRQVEEVEKVPDIQVQGPSTSVSRDKERRERDRDKDRPRERDKPADTQPPPKQQQTAEPAVATPTVVNPQPTYGKKKKRVMSSDETDLPPPNGSVAVARAKKREETDRASPVATNGVVKEKKTVKREDDRGKSRDEDFEPKRRKVVNGDHDSGRKQRETLGIGAGPGRPGKSSRVVSESTLTESDAETKRPAKKTGRARRNSNASNNTKSEKSGQRDDPRSVSQTPVPNARGGIKVIFQGQPNPLQPVELGGMLCWRGHTKRIYRVSWNPLNLTRLISCSQDGLCNIWDFAEPVKPDDQQLRSLTRVPIELAHRTLQTKNAVVDLAWNNDGNAFVTIDKANVARSFVGDGELQGTGYRHEREITCVAWNPNGNYFATTNIDGQTCVWDISVVPIKLKNSWEHHAPHKAYHVDWLTNDIFATCSEDYTVVLCSVNAADRLTTLTKHQDRVLVCKFSPKHRPEDKLPASGPFLTGTRRLLASGSDDHTVRIWDMQALEDEGAKIFSEPRDPAKQPKELLTLGGHVGDIQLIEWCPRLRKDGKRLLVTMAMADPQSSPEHRHVIKMYDVNAQDGKHCLYTITEHKDEIRALDFSPEGDFFMSCSDDGDLNIWHTETGQNRRQYRTDISIADAKWRPDGQQLALAMGDATLRTVYVGDLLNPSST